MPRFLKVSKLALIISSEYFPVFLRAFLEEAGSWGITVLKRFLSPGRRSGWSTYHNEVGQKGVLRSHKFEADTFLLPKELWESVRVLRGIRLLGRREKNCW